MILAGIIFRSRKVEAADAYRAVLAEATETLSMHGTLGQLESQARLIEARIADLV